MTAEIQFLITSAIFFPAHDYLSILNIFYAFYLNAVYLAQFVMRRILNVKL